MQLQSDGRLFSGDSTNLESYPYFGDDIYAVADGTVTSGLDGLDPNPPGVLPAADPVLAGRLAADLAGAPGLGTAPHAATGRSAQSTKAKPRGRAVSRSTGITTWEGYPTIAKCVRRSASVAAYGMLPTNKRTATAYPHLMEPNGLGWR